MNVTLIYDNTSWDASFTCDWGFACVVEAHGRTILFDTGAHGDLLGENMKKAGFSAGDIDAVFISHDHWDHTGGLSTFLEQNHRPVYVPESCPMRGDGVVVVRDACEIFPHIFSTGELEAIEQSLVIREGDYLVVITGCSHPGVRNILDAAGRFGKVNTLIGGLHDFSDFDVLMGMDCVCATHCSQFIPEIKHRFPKTFIEGGAGRVITVSGR